MLGAIVSLVLAVVTLAWLMLPLLSLGSMAVAPGDGRGPYVRDTRACDGTNVELHEVAENFGLRMPDDVADVRYYADRQPLSGDYSLELTFSLGEDALDRLLTDSGFPTLRRQTQSFDGFTDCPETGYVARPVGATKVTASGNVLWVVLRKAHGSVKVAVLGSEF